MNTELHQQRHIELHKMFEELLVDFIGVTGKYPSRTPIMELLEWSDRQAKALDHGIENPENKGGKQDEPIREGTESAPVCGTDPGSKSDGNAG